MMPTKEHVATGARTLVCSDLHGRPDVFEAILRHAGFSIGSDRLIIAGDLGDGRAGDGKVLEIAQSLEAEILVGNHELVHLDEFQAEDALFSFGMVLDHLRAKRWMIAAAVGDILVTHAGMSERVVARWGLSGVSAVQITKRLNHLGALLAHRLLLDEPIGAEGEIMESDGPVWYYPSNQDPPMSGIRQITGHRVPGYQMQWSDVADFEAQGFYHVDPGVRVHHEEDPSRIHIRYAAVQGGEVSVVDEYTR